MAVRLSYKPKAKFFFLQAFLALLTVDIIILELLLPVCGNF